MQTLGKDEPLSTSLRIPLHTCFRIIRKSVFARNSMFFMRLTNPANQEVNFDIISNVMTFLPVRVKSLDSV